MFRIIPVLLLKGKGLVKTTEFKNPVYLGDPINAVRIFNEKEVDELMLFDIEASRLQKEPNYSWVQDIVSESFMPVAYGGGICNLEQVKRIFDLGVEKVVLNTASFDLGLIEKASSIYGNQSIVACIDAKRNLFGSYNVYSKSGTVKHKIGPDVFARKLIETGVGEIIIQSIDREGSMIGFDLELTRLVSNSVNVPVVACGGAGKLDHFSTVIQDGNASSAAAGSFFVYKGVHKAVLINYPNSSDLNNLFK